ncbi:MAG TPA: ATP-dependent zinc metalloprotease FtsH [Thermoanaerobaculia bacterium]|nr:ATP-dependent zinc metalloprotease FtsH [Thermoanaerobaculia bacterium]
MNSTLKTLFLWMAIFVVVILLWNTFQSGKTTRHELKFSDFEQLIERGRVAEVTVHGQQISGKFRAGGEFAEGDEFHTQGPPDYSPVLVPKLRAAKVEVSYEEPKDSPLIGLLFTWAPVLVIVALWVFFMRQMQTGGNKALSFGKSKAKLLNTAGKKVTFKDVAGIEEAKEELSEIVDFLKEPQKFQKLGGRIPKGMLLMGPPGTGKTLLARAIAGEANVPFFSISGSDFVEMFVGVGASRVRDLFEQGKKNAPCIIFIDEIDAVGRHRGAGLGGGHDEREQTLNQLLVEMDGFESNEGVILIAATNRPDVLDPALLRPGRFDRRVIVDRPDINGRLGILKVHTRTIPLDEDVQLKVIARGTPGFAGADLANLVNEAALIAARLNKKKVEMADFEFAKDKVLMGVERKTLMLTDEEKRTTAYHEAGHALVAAFTPGADPLHKVTIIPRGRALGLTMQLPTEDKYTYRKQYVEAQIAILMGGRVAEELTQEDITTGAGNDIERATDIARRMCCEWGMSDLGPLSYGSKEEPVFLGRDFAQRADYSEDTAIRIDREVTRIVQKGYEQATAVLSAHRDVLDRLAHDLLERESLDGDEVYDIIRTMTGQDPAPTRPVAAGEGLVIAGHDVPEPVLAPHAAAAAAAEPAQSLPPGDSAAAAGSFPDPAGLPPPPPPPVEPGRNAVAQQEQEQEQEVEVAGAQRRSPLPAAPKKPS